MRLGEEFKIRGLADIIQNGKSFLGVLHFDKQLGFFLC